MSTFVRKLRERAARKASPHSSLFPAVVRTSYTNIPVEIPESFLAPLPDPSVISVERIQFDKTVLPEYRNLYAVVLDNVLTQEECNQLIHMAELSVGAHAPDGSGPEKNGWKPAMVNAGMDFEVLALHYRNSDRIIWDERVVVRRLWDRVLQGKGMKEDLLVLDGKEHRPILGISIDSLPKGKRWVATEQGLNERMRFLRYGSGQFFKEHCDGSYSTADGSQTSFFTIHIYLNDSAQALGASPTSIAGTADTETLLQGGATTFHSNNGE